MHSKIRNPIRQMDGYSITHSHIPFLSAYFKPDFEPIQAFLDGIAAKIGE